MALLDRRAVRLLIGDDRPPPALPRTDPLAALTAALRDPRNWSAPLPQQSRQLVSFRNRPGSGDVLVHPLGELGVRQSVLPLGIELDLFAGGVPGGERRFTITKAFLGGDPVTDLRIANDQFAAADFIELTDDEKLHRPSFEAMPAGVNLVAEGARLRRAGARDGRTRPRTPRSTSRRS